MLRRSPPKGGIYFQLPVGSRKFAIIGDAGINAVVPENFWDGIKEQMRVNFAAGNYVDGLVQAIRESGVSLKRYFPYQSDDINEQPDEISFGE